MCNLIAQSKCDSDWGGIVKKWVISILALLWVAVLVRFLSGLGSPAAEEHLATEAFNGAVFSVKGSEVSGYGSYGQAELAVEEQKAFLNRLANQIGLVDLYTISTREENQKKITELYKDGANASTRLEFVTLAEEGVGNIQYVCVSLKFYQDMGSALGYREKAEDVFRKNNINAAINVKFFGSCPGNLSLKEKDDIAGRLFQLAGGTTVSSHEEGSLYFAQGYTPDIEGYKISETKKVNLCLEMGYDELQGETYIELTTSL